MSKVDTELFGIDKTENKIRMIECPSIIKKDNFEKSLSDSSILSYNQYTDLLNIQPKEQINPLKIMSYRQSPYFITINVNQKINSNSTKDNKKISKLNKIKPSNNNNSIRKKIQELKEQNIDYKKTRVHFSPYNPYISYTKTDSNLNIPSKSLTQFISKIVDKKSKNDILKKINKDNYDTLEKKGKKLLNGLISSKFDDDDDINDFKNQFEIGKKSPFGILDFQKKFKSNFISKNYKSIFNRNRIQKVKQSQDDIYF